MHGENYRRIALIILFIAIAVISTGAERGSIKYNDIDFAAEGFTKMSTTAYCVGHHTANGSAVHEGGCACSIDHIGDVAIVYTLNGEFLGYFECNDTGAEGGGVRKGTVIDIYRADDPDSDLERCKEWMNITGGKVWVKWINGNG